VSIRVVIADDQALVRAGFSMILDAEEDMEVVGEASDGKEAVSAVRRLHPDVVLMDIRMPEQDGIEATRQLTAPGVDGATPRILILTTFDLDEYVYEALRAGASGFLLKDTPPEELVAAIRVVAGGDALLSPSVTRRVIEEFVSKKRPGQKPPRGLDDLTAREHEVLTLVARGDALIAPGITKRLIEQFARSAPAAVPSDALADVTPRETEVLVLVANGLSNGEIANELVLSSATVKTHVKRILSKLGLRDRVQAVVLAYEVGLVYPGAPSARTQGDRRATTSG